MLRRSLFTLALLATISYSSTSAVHARTNANRPAAEWVGEISAIHVGVKVQLPKGPLREGHIQQTMYAQQGLLTASSQRASLTFRDHSILHVNQQSSVVLKSPNKTYVTKGQVDQQIVPGTQHTVETASAVASAIGSEFLVVVTASGTLVATLEGSVLVYNEYGYVTVETGQATQVQSGQAPQTPAPYNVRGALGWVSDVAVPGSQLGTNLALQANGGHIIAVSSEQGGATTDRPATGTLAIDGTLQRGWGTAEGHAKNEWLKVGFHTDNLYSITGVAISTAPFGNYSPSGMLRHFEIRASQGGTGDGDFTRVFSGQVHQETTLQRFAFKKPIQARYIELYAIDNYGDAHAIAITEFEVSGALSTAPVNDTCMPARPCIQSIVDKLNQARQVLHLAPLRLDDSLSTGTGKCVGAYGHSVAMAITHSLWHTNHRFPLASFPNDICRPFHNASENVGEYPSRDPQADIPIILNTWLNEPHDPTTCKKGVTHSCNVFHADWQAIGVGLYFDGSVIWITVDFVQ